MSKFDIRDYMKNNKFEMGEYETAEMKSVGRRDSDIRKTNYEVNILKDGKLDLYSHKKVIAEGKRRKLSEKRFNSKTDVLNAYLKGDISVEDVKDQAKRIGTKVATRKELDGFLGNGFLQDVMADTHNISKPQLVKRVKELRNNLNENVQNDNEESSGYNNRWLELKMDDERTPNQKLGHGLREIRKQLTEIEKFLRWYGRIKNENDIGRGDYWKRTNKNINKIREKLVRISNKMREF